MSKKLNFSVIFNANAAGGRKLKLINEVIYLLEKNHIVDLFKTQSEEHARKVFKELSNKQFDRLVIAGGDGSVCFGINEMFKSDNLKDKLVGYIPAVSYTHLTLTTKA